MKPQKKIKNHKLIDLYKSFDDLIFYAHPNLRGGVQAIMKFDNNHHISVVGGHEGVYGDGDITFEIWRSCDDDVKGWLSREEVTHYMIELQKLDTTTPRSTFGF